MCEVRAVEVLALLAERHLGDVFVPECKSGPTHGAQHVRLDAWAMRRSWSKPSTFGYEIKVSRSDFLRDDKWHSYLGLCSDFYFVTAHGICTLSEIPEPAGWIEVSKTESRLFTRKKAPTRYNVAIPEDLFRYVLMCRSRISRHDLDERRGPTNGLDYWRTWLAERSEKKTVGGRVSRALREALFNAEIATKAAVKRAESYEEIRECLHGHGIDENTRSTWIVDRRIEDLRKIMNPEIARALNEAERAIANLKTMAGKTVNCEIGVTRGGAKP